MRIHNDVCCTWIGFSSYRRVRLHRLFLRINNKVREILDGRKIRQLGEMRPPPPPSFLFPYQVERVIETVTRTAIEEIINDCNIVCAFIYEQISTFFLFFIKANERCSNEIWFPFENGVSNSFSFLVCICVCVCVITCINVLEKFDEKKKNIFWRLSSHKR